MISLTGEEGRRGYPGRGRNVRDILFYMQEDTDYQLHFIA
ncbi:hypothetical protein CBFG_03966 [Clostridiales bacterium 1_7_47FAA]|nr:hypothetical protein CBFG_03966 [Clostridiales bacterium 1_7_47FAA]